MAKIRISSRFDRNFSVGESDIYRKFSEQFENLFNSEEVSKTDSEFEKTYVHDFDFEKKLESFKTSKTSMAKFCVGYTGIGKTTSIRTVFHLGVSNEVKFFKKSGEIVFPTFLDGYNLDDIKKFDISKRLSAVCTQMEKIHPELKILMKSKEGKKEFHDFILKHTDFALENIDPIDAMDMEENELIIERLRGAAEKNGYEYQANRLKFYIYKKSDIYNRLIIILDDIETLPEKYLKQTIKKYLKLYSCMQNTDYVEGKKYNVNLLISVRPHTHRLFNENREIETFPISEPAILKNDSVDLVEIFKKRFDYYTKSSNKEIGNVETWERCRAALMEMSNQFNGQYKKMIKSLCFMNIRESLASYSRIFANRYWVQKNKPKEDAFIVTVPDYSFNNINVIRALACNEERVFFGDNNPIIPNIFYTTEDTDLIIYCLLVIKYFVMKTRGLSYGLNAEPLLETFELWDEVFSIDSLNKIKKAMYYLFERKVLRKSIIDFEDFDTMDRSSSLNENTHLYISPRGNELYNMFGNDSVLLEMLRECSWRDYNNGREYSTEASSELMKKSQQKTIFIDLLEYISYLCEQEEGVLSTVNNKDLYRGLFGTESMLHQLLLGVKNSLDYSGIMSDEIVRIKYNFVNSQILEITNKI